MKRFGMFAFVIFTAFLFAGCERDSGAAGQVELSGNDVARALGMNAWEVTLPADHGKDETLGLMLKYPDGSIKRLSGIGFLSPGTDCKVVVWSSDDKFRYALLTDGDSIRSSGMDIKEIVGDYQGSILFGGERKLGEMLMKWGNDEVLSSSIIDEGEVALILDVWE